MNELATVTTTALAPMPAAYVMPIVDVAQAVERRRVIKLFVENCMVEDHDYGTIPGVSDKPTLLKPGAENLCSFFGLVPQFSLVESICDFDGNGEGNGEPLILYHFRCELYRDRVLVGAGSGLCHSRETKYRWRKANRICPNCFKPAIRRGAEQYGGGYYCDRKQDGCGAKYKTGDPAIENQPDGRIPNPDVPDLANTILKMAQKRALVAATLIATAASSFFTQDVEDSAPPQRTQPARTQPQDIDLGMGETNGTEQRTNGTGTETWRDWKSPTDAHKWAMSAGPMTQKDAFDVWKVVISRPPWGGKVTQDALPAMYQAYYDEITNTND